MIIIVIFFCNVQFKESSLVVFRNKLGSQPCLERPRRRPKSKLAQLSQTWLLSPFSRSNPIHSFNHRSSSPPPPLPTLHYPAPAHPAPSACPWTQPESGSPSVSRRSIQEGSGRTGSRVGGCTIRSFVLLFAFCQVAREGGEGADTLGWDGVDGETDVRVGA